MDQDSNSEKEEFQNHISEEIDFRNYFLRKKFSLPDPEDELNLFKARLEEESRPNVLFKFTSIAASILLIAFAYLYITNFSFFRKSSQPVHFVESTSIDNVMLKNGDDAEIEVENDFMKLGLNSDRPKYESGKLNYSEISNTAEVEEQIVSVPNKKMLCVVLQDGSQVWLNANSKLIFPSVFKGRFRQVKLEGEGYFVVSKNKYRPFIVESNGLKTTVLGTEFNLRSFDNGESRVTLLEGKVDVLTKGGDKSDILTPGYELSVNSEAEKSVSKFDLSDYSSWHKGFFYFDNVAISEVLREIARWHNLNVTFKNPKQLSVKVRFFADRSEELAQLLELLNSYGYFKVSLEHNVLVVR